MSEIVKVFKTMHDRKKWMLVGAAHSDRNKKGFIDADEFKYVLEQVVSHDPTVAGVTYEQFVEEADLNQVRMGRLALRNVRIGLKTMLLLKFNLPFPQSSTTL